LLQVVLNAAGEPMVRFDREQYSLPQDWQLVVADAAEFRAHYAKQHVDRLESSANAGNQLGQLLRGWFGDEAGVASARHRIRQTQAADGRYIWRPARASAVSDEQGRELDAHFDLELFEAETTIVFHSRGGGDVIRNADYTAGLRQVLKRLGDHRVSITRIAVESSATRTLPLEARVLQLTDNPYPIDVGAQDVAALQAKIGRATAAIGRKPGAKGQGNNTKRLRLWLDRELDAVSVAQDRAVRV
jgi:hypothetical protein